MSLAAIAFLSGTIAAFVAFAVALAYVTHTYQRFRRQTIEVREPAPVPLRVVAQEQSLGATHKRAG
jgi:hypothetical protein